MRHLVEEVRLVSRTVLAATAAAVLLLTPDGAYAQQKLLYTLSNNAAGQNSVVAYHRRPNGELTPHAAGPFSTRGSGIDNDTNGKLGPNDNDTPLAMTGDRRFLFAVNGHSNTIAAFRVGADGALAHVAGSPFPSEGIGPVSLAIAGDVLLVANRNEDPLQLSALGGGARANYASFRIGADGGLSFISKVELPDGEKNTQVLVSRQDGRLVFGNDFRVDVDFDGEGPVSKLFGPAPAVLGGLRAFRLNGRGVLTEVDAQRIPETVDPAPDVPTIPLGIWDHPTRKLLYVGLVTRNQLGVFRYDDAGKLTFVSAVPNSGQDICWIKTSSDGTRLYAVNNLPRDEEMDGASTVTVFDISGPRAERPVEIGRIELPYPSGTFVNNRAISQPGSTAFQFDLDEDAGYLYVVSQRIDQTPGNSSDEGNFLHTVRFDDAGSLAVVASRRMTADGVMPRSRPQGVLVVDIG